METNSVLIKAGISTNEVIVKIVGGILVIVVAAMMLWCLIPTGAGVAQAKDELNIPVIVNGTTNYRNYASHDSDSKPENYDGFPVLDDLRKLFDIFTEAQNNQFGDLPSTPRI